MARMTGLQAYTRALKLLIEDAEAELDEAEWLSLRETLFIGLDLRLPAAEPIASRKAPSPTPR